MTDEHVADDWRRRANSADRADGVDSAGRADSVECTDSTDSAGSSAATEPKDDRVGSLDGGVTRRLAARCGIAAGGLSVLAVVCLVVVVVRDRSLLTALLTLVAWASALVAIALWRRWALWNSVAHASLPAGRGTPAIIGEPRALSPRTAGRPINRRFGAMVLPIRASSGASPGDGAVIVHARADGVAPAAGDRLRIMPISGWRNPLAPGNNPRRAVRVLLLRGPDAALFVATTRVTDTW